MCLGIPGRVIAWRNRDPLLAEADIDFGGVRKRCHMACVPEANVGDFVLVHAGVAITVVDAAAAERTLATLNAALPSVPEGPSSP
jgi:hydrogenase expression/formation protein HypC